MIEMYKSFNSEIMCVFWIRTQKSSSNLNYYRKVVTNELIRITSKPMEWPQNTISKVEITIQWRSTISKIKESSNNTFFHF